MRNIWYLGMSLIVDISHCSKMSVFTNIAKLLKKCSLSSFRIDKQLQTNISVRMQMTCKFRNLMILFCYLQSIICGLWFLFYILVVIWLPDRYSHDKQNNPCQSSLFAPIAKQKKRKVVWNKIVGQKERTKFSVCFSMIL